MQKLTNFTNSIVRAGYVDGFLVEFFPALQHIPAAFAPWKKEALRAAPQFTQLFKDLYFAVKTRVVRIPVPDIANGERPLHAYAHMLILPVIIAITMMIFNVAGGRR